MLWLARYPKASQKNGSGKFCWCLLNHLIYSAPLYRCIKEQRGNLLDVIEHPNRQKYPYQKMLVVKIKDYACLIPFVEDEESRFLKTIIPSRKATRD